MGPSMTKADHEALLTRALRQAQELPAVPRPEADRSLEEIAASAERVEALLVEAAAVEDRKAQSPCNGTPGGEPNCPACRDGECPLHLGTPSHLGAPLLHPPAARETPLTYEKRVRALRPVYEGFPSTVERFEAASLAREADGEIGRLLSEIAALRDERQNWQRTLFEKAEAERQSLVARADGLQRNIEELKAFTDRELEMCVARAEQERSAGCPCLYTAPCQPDCTCVKPMMSHGCLRCCRYGSVEQRTAMAEHLVQRESLTTEHAALKAQLEASERRRAEVEQALRDIHDEIHGDNERNALGSCIKITDVVRAALTPSPEAPTGEEPTRG